MAKNELIQETYDSALKALKAETEKGLINPARVEALTRAVQVLSLLPKSLI